MNAHHPKPRRGLRARLVLVVSALVAVPVALVVAAIAAPAASAEVSPVLERDAATVTNEPLPTVQINGIVWDQEIVGNTVYVVGSFTSARPAGAPAGTNETPRSNILAYDITTGELISGFNASLNRQGLSITSAPDGSRIYVAGEFTQANGVNRYRMAAFDPTTGALVNSFFPVVDYRVSAIEATATTVYAGGAFSKAGGGLTETRTRLAAFSATNGAVLPWAPSADAEVLDLIVTPDAQRVVIAGRFQNVNGSPFYGMAALDPGTGATVSWPVEQQVRNAGTSSAITTLKTDGTKVYGTGYHYGSGGNLEGTFAADAATGQLDWVQSCNGDTHDAEPMNGFVYTVSHVHYCGNVGSMPQSNPWSINQRHALAFTADARGTNRLDPWNYFNWRGTPAPANVQWFPEWTPGAVAGQAGWTVEGNGTYVSVGGEFLGVNSSNQQQGLVRFAVKPAAPGADGPRLGGATFAYNVRSNAPGEVRVSFPANYDRDSNVLNYRIYRENTVVHETNVASTYWDRPIVGFTDTGLTPGSVVNYRVRAQDADGNVMWGNTVPVTVSGTGDASAYANSVMANGARVHWRFGDAAGSASATDELGMRNATVGAGVSLNQNGALLNETDRAASFNGTNSAVVADNLLTDHQDTFSVEAWFNTTTTQGGRIIGYGNSRTGSSSQADRLLYLRNNGAVIFGTEYEGKKTLSSASGLNNGQWHHVVGTVGADGMHLYIDGVRVASRGDAMGGRGMYGYWRVGFDNLNGWPNRPSKDSLSGRIDEAAVYAKVLTPAQVAANYTASGRTPALPPVPADAYGAAVHATSPYLYHRLDEASGTTAADAGSARNDSDYVGTVGRGAAGRVTGNAAVTLAGNGFVAGRSATYNPSNYSVAAWFNTTTTTGGSIAAFGDSATADSATVDRQVLMGNDGRLVFRSLTPTGAPGASITSPSAYNDGAWHLVVVTQGDDGTKLYVDGNQVAAAADRLAKPFTGYWKFGREATAGLSGTPGFSGVLDEVSVHGRVLGAAQISQLYTLGSGELPPSPPTAAFTPTIDKLALSVDGSASSDLDGTVVDWAWDFGDGATGSGATATHTYAAAGTYTVALTVTDDDGDAASTSQQVVAVANVAPTAAFTPSIDKLVLALDASASTDPDGTMASLAWDLGDGNTATGATVNHTYAAAGTYTVTLTVTDDDGATAQSAQQVVAVANVAPTAAFSATPTNMSVALNAGGSSDPDGTIASYGWNLGDGNTATGSTVNHTYATPGTYTVTLTVTDDDGATAQSSQSVNAALPVGPVTVASDTFGRTSATGWGNAELGGAWTVLGSAARYSVAGGVGRHTLDVPGRTTNSYLTSVSATDVTVGTDLAFDKAPTGGGVYTYVSARINGTNEYRARVRTMPTSTNLTISRVVGGVETSLTSVNVPGLVYTPGQIWRVELTATGTTPTSLSAKVWNTAGAEPALPQATTTDATAQLQVPGGAGLINYLSGSATNAPVTVSPDNFEVVELH